MKVFLFFVILWKPKVPQMNSKTIKKSCKNFLWKKKKEMKNVQEKKEKSIV